MPEKTFGAVISGIKERMLLYIKDREICQREPATGRHFSVEYRRAGRERSRQSIFQVIKKRN